MIRVEFSATGSHVTFVLGLMTRSDIDVDLTLSLTLDKLYAPSTTPVINYGNSDTLIQSMIDIEKIVETNCTTCDAIFQECGIRDI